MNDLLETVMVVICHFFVWVKPPYVFPIFLSAGLHRMPRLKYSKQWVNHLNVAV